MSGPKGGAAGAETWVVVPLRGLEAAKSRLGGQLDAEERLDLVTGLLERTLEAARTCPAVDRVLLVSPDPAALELGRAMGAETLREPGQGLNAALAAARDRALAGGAATLVVLPADLPRVSPEAIERLIEAARPASDPAAPGRSGMAAHDNLPSPPVVALVPDRHGGGTNALLVSPPEVIPFSFGTDSRDLHRAAAATAGARYIELEGELELDVDTPDDLLLAELALSPTEQAAAAHHEPLRG